MRRPSFPFLVIATVLALLLPLEQAHCLWMGAGAKTSAHGAIAAAKMAPDHSCCRGHAAARSRATSEACVCLQLPAAAVPPATLLSAPPSAPMSHAMLAVLASLASVEPAAVFVAAVPPDVGSAPLPVTPRAHGLRAPPATA